MTAFIVMRYHILDTYSPYLNGLEDSQNLSYVDSIKDVTENISYTGTLETPEPVNSTYIDNIYDENLKATDKDNFRKIIEQIKNSGEYNDTMIVFVGNHGEIMGEDNIYGHPPAGNRKELIKVPLIVKYPEQKGI